jgi:mono/diheme cytochrome c family protein
LPVAGQPAAELPAPQAAYLKKVASSGPSVVSPGQAIYESLCLNCHQASGQGLTGVYPPLAKSEWVAGNPEALIKLTIHGLAGPTKVLGKDYGLVPMPPMGLDDQQLADVLTYVRTAFGNSAPAVTTSEVKAIREATKGRTAPWTAAELGK